MNTDKILTPEKYADLIGVADYYAKHKPILSALSIQEQIDFLRDYARMRKEDMNE